MRLPRGRRTAVAVLSTAVLLGSAWLAVTLRRRFRAGSRGSAWPRFVAAA
jgi:hypothetical protein